MSSKSLFTEQEWSLLEQAPYWVYHTVASADGVVDKKEQKAFKRVLQNYTEFNNDLTREVLQAARISFDDEADYDGSDIKNGIASLNEILGEKLDQADALVFKKTLIAIGIHVGNSSGGIFSTKFSDEEVEALKEVGQLLNISENQLSQSPSIKELINNMNK